MCPKSLTHYRSLPEYKDGIDDFSSGALRDTPGLAATIAEIISRNSELESYLLAGALACTAAPAETIAHIWTKAFHTRARLGVVLATIEAANIDEEGKQLFRAVDSLAEICRGFRNRLAHWIIGTTNSPEGLLLIDPGVQAAFVADTESYDREVMGWALSGSRGAFGRPLNFTPNPDKVLLYERGELEDECDRVQRVGWLAESLPNALGRSGTMRHIGRSTLKSDEWVREALARLSKGKSQGI